MVEILDKAKEIVYGSRNRAYGSGNIEFQKIADVFNALTGKGITKDQAVLFMIILKLVRETYRHKKDNLVDAAGYLEILAQVMLTLKPKV